MAADQVIGVLRSVADSEGESGTWFALVERLLRLANRHAKDYRTAATEDESAVQNVREDLRGEAGPLLAQHRRVQVSSHAALALADLLKQHWGRLANEGAQIAAAAAGIADAIDDELHGTFVARLRDGGEQVLRPGAAHYVHRYHPGEEPRLVAGQIGTDPARMMAGDLTRTKHVRLGGEETGVHRYVFDWDSYGRLSPLASVERLLVAVCVPNVELGEFDIRPSGPGAFCNYGPVSPQHGEVLVEQLILAAEAGAHVVLFPEYTVTVEQRGVLTAKLRERIEAGLPVPIAVLAGTSMTGPLPPSGEGPAEMDQDARLDRRDNEACLIVTTGVTPNLPWAMTTLLHQKCFPAVIDGTREDIAAADHQFRVYVTERFAVAVLICMDAMNTGVVRQLADMGANLVLVPSMTRKTSALVQQICGLAATSQAVVAFGNAPAWWPDSEGRDSRVLAAFHGPYEAHPTPLYLPEEEDRPLKRIAVWLWDVYDRRVEELKSGRYS